MQSVRSTIACNAATSAHKFSNKMIYKADVILILKQSSGFLLVVRELQVHQQGNNLF